MDKRSQINFKLIGIVLLVVIIIVAVLGFGGYFTLSDTEETIIQITINDPDFSNPGTVKGIFITGNVEKIEEYSITLSSSNKILDIISLDPIETIPLYYDKILQNAPIGDLQLADEIQIYGIEQKDSFKIQHIILISGSYIVPEEFNIPVPEDFTIPLPQS